jgi:hypothetical protein
VINQEAVSFHRKQSLLDEGCRLTRYNNQQIIRGEASFDFVYRRDAFEFHLKKESLKYIGVPRLTKDSFNKIFLTNSGQAAINAIYFLIDKILQIKEIESHNDYLYVGAYKLQELYKVYHSKKKSTCLWICSTATSFEKTMQLTGRWDFVIADTTCWGVSSAEIQQIYDQFSATSTLILFRSHSKLDMGGVEYGSLGSISILSKKQDVITKLSTDFTAILGLTGGYAVLDEIPPYLFTEEFYTNSITRVETIIENVKSLKNELIQKSQINSSLGTFVFPDHYKYFFFKFYKDTSDLKLEKTIQRLNFLLALNAPYVKSCASFGFNFPSFTHYKAEDASGDYIRISLGVVNNDQLKTLTECLQETFGV